MTRFHKILSVFSVAAFGVGLFVASVIMEKPVGQIVPCRADTTRPAHERIKDCPIPANERASFKGQEIARKAQLGKVARQNYDIEIVEVKAIENGVEVFARAWKDGKQIGFGKDGTVDIERFRIINPPVLVDDPQGNIVREWTDELTGELHTRKLKEDPQEALLQVLEHNLSVMTNIHGSERIVAGKRGNTTTTVFSTASGDGRTRHAPGGGASWDTVHDAATSNDSQTGNATTQILTQCSATNNFVIHRIFFPFDTSSISAGDTIDSATFSWYVTSVTNDDNDASAYANIVQTSQADSTTLTTADYDQCGAVNSPTQISTAIGLNSLTTSAYNDWILNDNTVVKKSGETPTCGTTDGVTCIGVREGHDIDDHPIACSDNINTVSGSTSDETGTTQDPKLVVEHGAAAAGFENNPNDFFGY